MVRRFRAGTGIRKAPEPSAVVVPQELEQRQTTQPLTVEQQKEELYYEIARLKSQGKRTAHLFYEGRERFESKATSEDNDSFVRGYNQFLAENPRIRSAVRSGTELKSRAREAGFDDAQEFVSISIRQQKAAGPRPEFVDELGQGVSAAPEAVNRVAGRQMSFDEGAFTNLQFNEAINIAVSRTDQRFAESGRSTGQVVKQRFTQVGIGAARSTTNVAEAGLSFLATGFAQGQKANIDFSTLPGSTGTFFRDIKSAGISREASVLGKGFVYGPLIGAAVVGGGGVFSRSLKVKEGKLIGINRKVITSEFSQAFSPIIPRQKTFFLKDSFGKLELTGQPGLKSGSKDVFSSINLDVTGPKRVELSPSKVEVLRAKGDVLATGSRTIADIQYANVISFESGGLIRGAKLNTESLSLSQVKSTQFKGSIEDDFFKGVKIEAGIRNQLTRDFNTEAGFKTVTRGFGDVKEVSAINYNLESFKIGNKLNFAKISETFGSNADTVKSITFTTERSLIAPKGIDRDISFNVGKSLDPKDVKAFTFGGKFFNTKAILTKGGGISQGKERILTRIKDLRVGRSLGDDQGVSSPQSIVPKDLGGLSSISGSSFDSLGGSKFGATSKVTGKFLNFGSQPKSTEYQSIGRLPGSKFSLNTVPKVRSNVITVSKQRSNQKGLSALASFSKSAQISITNQKGKQLQGILTAQKTTSVSKAITKQKTIPFVFGGSIGRTKLLPPKTPRTPPIPPFKNDLFQTKRNNNGFLVSVRRFGKFRTVGRARTVKEAVSIGRGITSSTLAASFKITPVGKGRTQPFKIPGFTRSKRKREDNVFVELPKFRLSSKSEKNEIRRFRL